MKVSEVVRFLKKNGIQLAEHGKRHDRYYSPITGKTFSVSRHMKEEMPKGTLHAILKEAGLKLP